MLSRNSPNQRENKRFDREPRWQCLRKQPRNCSYTISFDSQSADQLHKLGKHQVVVKCTQCIKTRVMMDGLLL